MEFENLLNYFIVDENKKKSFKGDSERNPNLKYTSSVHKQK